MKVLKSVSIGIGLFLGSVQVATASKDPCVRASMGENVATSVGGASQGKSNGQCSSQSTPQTRTQVVTGLDGKTTTVPAYSKPTIYRRSVRELLYGDDTGSLFSRDAESPAPPVPSIRSPSEDSSALLRRQAQPPKDVNNNNPHYNGLHYPRNAPIAGFGLSDLQTREAQLVEATLQDNTLWSRGAPQGNEEPFYLQARNPGYYDQYLEERNPRVSDDIGLHVREPTYDGQTFWTRDPGMDGYFHESKPAGRHRTMRLLEPRHRL